MTGLQKFTVQSKERDREIYMAFSPDGTLLAISHDQPFVELWDTVNGKQLSISYRFTIDPPGRKPNDVSITIAAKGAVAFSPDGKFLATGITLGPETAIWETLSGKLYKTLKGPTLTPYHPPDNPLTNVEFSPDGKFVAAAGWGLAVTQIGTEQRLLDVDGSFSSIAFNPTGTVLAFGTSTGSRPGILLHSI